jgi:PAS domain S-box-containing protein
MSIHKKIDEFRQRVDRYSSNPDQISESDVPLHQLLEELSTALEELQVMQEELEVQNEEIEASRSEAVLQSQRYQELFDFAPDAYVVTDEKFIIQEANLATVELLNLRPDFIIGKLLVSFVCDNDRRSFRSLIMQIAEKTDFEICLKPRDASEITVSVRVAPIQDSSGHITGYRWILRDISPEKQLQVTLQESEKRFRNIFHTASIGTALLDSTGNIVECNQAFVNFLGADPVENGGKPLQEYVHPHDRMILEEHRRSILEEQKPTAHYEVRFYEGSGKQVWGTVTLTMMRMQPDEDPLLLMMVEDITEQKWALDEREEMQRRIIDSIEAERAHLARELHDNPLQDLYVILYELENAIAAKSNPEFGERVENMRTLLLAVVNTLRETCGELRPPTLLRYGVESAVNSYIETITSLHPEVNIKLNSSINTRNLPENLTITLYRVIQESLHNVIRHSEANNVIITLGTVDGKLKVRIEDNGKGFIVPDSLLQLMRDGHYGLAGMQERSKAIDGELAIISAPGQGTAVELSAPLKQKG